MIADLLRPLGLQRHEVVTVLLLALGTGIFEGLGMGMLLPILEWVEGGQQSGTLEGAHWQVLFDVFGWLGLPLSLYSLLGTTFLLVLMRQLMIFSRSVYAVWLREKMVAHVREEIFRRFISADFQRATDFGSGKTINIATVEGPRAAGAVHSVFQLVGFGAVSLMYGVLLLYLSWQMTLLSVVVMLVLAWGLRVFVGATYERGAAVTEANERLAAWFVDRLRGLRLIKLSGAEKREIVALEDQSRRLRDDSWVIGRLLAQTEAVFEPVIVLMGFALLALAVEGFGLGLAQVGLFLFVLIRIAPLFREIVKSRQTFASYRPSLDKVQTAIGRLSGEREIESGSEHLEKIREGIHFERVSFHYREGTPVLRDIDLFIPAGEMTALVGPSGAGKSTLVDLLPRLRIPQSGRILVDGTPLDDFQLADLRRAIAYVSQDPMLFDASVLENIRYGVWEATRAEVEDAARRAHAHTFITELESGYDTLLGEAGDRLSGGQKQRISLARALLRGAFIVILDEPTSALDPESEQNIREALGELRAEGETTFVVIAHRFTTIQGADQIVILEDGIVRQTGKHDELKGKGSWYARMLSLQER